MDEVSKKTRKFESLLIALLFTCYAFAYIGRISYNSNIVEIIDKFNVTKKDTGIVTTCYFFAYGAFTIINGFLVKKYNKKIVIPIVLAISSLMNLLIFLGIDFRFYKYLWLVNGICQSFLWVSISHIVSRYIGKRVRLPFNVDVTEKRAVDKTLINYAGRESPVSYYGTAIDKSYSIKTEIPKHNVNEFNSDEAMLLLRQLSIKKEDVYVRTCTGVGCWATVDIEYNIDHCALTIPITITVTPVEGGA